MTPAGTSNELDVLNEWEENTTMYLCRILLVITIYRNSSNDKPGKVVNPTHSQLNKEDEYFPVTVSVRA